MTQTGSSLRRLTVSPSLRRHRSLPLSNTLEHRLLPLAPQKLRRVNTTARRVINTTFTRALPDKVSHGRIDRSEKKHIRALLRREHDVEEDDFLSLIAELGWSEDDWDRGYTDDFTVPNVGLTRTMSTISIGEVEGHIPLVNSSESSPA